MNLIRLSSLLTLTLFLLGSAQAASEAPKEPPLYDVELVVFAQPGPADDERLSRSMELPDRSRWIDLDQKTPNESFSKLQPRALAAEARALERKGYQVLVHLAWRQPGIDRATAPAITLRSDALAVDGNPLLEGSVTIGLSRYLHANFDLLLRGQLVGGNSTMQTPSPFSSEVPARVEMHRRMRSGQLHYLDNPRIGILIRIDKFERPEPEVAVPQATPVVEQLPTTTPAPSATPDTESKPAAQ